MEEISISFDGQACGTLPLSRLPSLRLFCEEHGIRFRWGPNESQVFLQSGLAGKICVLKWEESPVPANEEERQLEREMLLQIQKSLIHAGIGVVIASSMSVTPVSDSVMEISVRIDEKTSTPKVTLYPRVQEENTGQSLVGCLENALKDAHLAVVVHTPAIHSPVTEIHCLIPSRMEPPLRLHWIHYLGFAVSTGLIRHYLAEANVSAWACFKSALLNFIKAQQAPMEQEQEKPNRETNSTKKEAPSIKETEITDIGQPATEVFFDYTVIRSELENQPFLIIGNLSIKNIGKAVLTNPLVCLRATPPENIRLSGQILPSNWVETMAVQSTDGAKGWRFLEQNELPRGQQQGEYWMAPIHPVRIMPGQTYAFQNFRINVLAAIPENRHVIVEGLVYFPEQQCQFAANNRISLSY